MFQTDDYEDELSHVCVCVNVESFGALTMSDVQFEVAQDEHVTLMRF